MGTRANIKLTQDLSKYEPRRGENVKPNTIWLYHHWDGYLSCLGAELQEFMIWYYQQPDCCRPYIEDLATALVKGRFKDNLADKRDIPAIADDDGFEITTCQHGDIEYLYTITEHWVGRSVSHITLEAYCIYADVKGTLVDVDVKSMCSGPFAIEGKSAVSVPMTWKELETIERREDEEVESDL